MERSRTTGGRSTVFRDLTSLLRLTPKVVIVVGPEGEVLSANRACLRLVGVGLQTVRGTPISSLICPSDRAVAERAVEECRSGGAGTRTLRIEMLSARELRITLVGHVHRASRLGGCVLVLRDVSSLVDEVGAREHYIRSLYEKTPVMMHLLNSKGVLEFVSDAWLERLGYRREEVLGRPSVEFLTPQSRIRAAAALTGFLETGTAGPHDYDMVSKTGEIVPVTLQGYMERDPEGAFLRSRATIVDRSTEVRLRRELAEARREIGDQLEDLPIPVARTDASFRVVAVNSIFRTAFQCEEAPSAGLSLVAAAQRYRDLPFFAEAALQARTDPTSPRGSAAERGRAKACPTIANG